MYGWVGGWMSEWMDGQADRWIDGWVDGQMDGQTNGWLDGQWMNGWMDGGHIRIPALEAQAGANIRTGRQAKISWGEFIFGPRFHHKSKTNPQSCH